MRNKDSFFKKNVLPGLKVLNVIALCIFPLGIVTNLADIKFLKVTNLVYIIIFGLSPILATVFVSRINNHHEFFEWDKNEREKKKTFLITLIPIVFFFTYLSVFLLSTTISDLINIDFKELDRPDKIVFIIRILTGILSLANAIFSVQLHYGLYSSSLTLDEYKLAKKPDNWDWERTSADDIADAFGR